MRRTLLYPALVTLALLGTGATGSAEVVRFSYKPAHSCSYGYTSLKVGPDGATGEWSPTLLSVSKKAYYCQPKATHMVTFYHPCTNQTVTVPIAFPLGTPQIAHQTNAIVYSYTSYTIRVEFLGDGSVDVIYNSGLGRPVTP
jgi:hypothetical protein